MNFTDIFSPSQVDFHLSELLESSFEHQVVHPIVVFEIVQLGHADVPGRESLQVELRGKHQDEVGLVANERRQLLVHELDRHVAGIELVLAGEGRERARELDQRGPAVALAEQVDGESALDLGLLAAADGELRHPVGAKVRLELVLDGANHVLARQPPQHARALVDRQLLDPGADAPGSQLAAVVQEPVDAPVLDVVALQVENRAEVGGDFAQFAHVVANQLWRAVVMASSALNAVAHAV